MSILRIFEEIVPDEIDLCTALLITLMCAVSGYIRLNRPCIGIMTVRNISLMPMWITQSYTLKFEIPRYFSRSCRPFLRDSVWWTKDTLFTNCTGNILLRFTVIHVTLTFCLLIWILFATCDPVMVCVCAKYEANRSNRPRNGATDRTHWLYYYKISSESVE